MHAHEGEAAGETDGYESAWGPHADQVHHYDFRHKWSVIVCAGLMLLQGWQR